MPHSENTPPSLSIDQLITTAQLGTLDELLRRAEELERRIERLQGGGPDRRP